MRLSFIILRSTEVVAAMFALCLVASCSGAKSGISAGGNNNGVGPGSLASFKVLTFQGNPSTSWNTDTPSVWKTNLNTVSITGTCARGISSINVSYRVSGSSSPAVDSGLSATCLNNAFAWSKSFAAEANYVATSAGSGIQYDFNIYALDGLGSQVVDSTALSAVKFYKLANTVLTSVKYYKTYIQQTVAVSGATTSITDNPDPDTGLPGHCTSSTAQFTLTGTLDPQATVGVTGATSTNSSSGTTMSFLVCVPFGSTTLTINSKDESGTSFGTQYTVNLTSATIMQTIGSSDQGFKSQNLSPNLASIPVSQGISLINISSDHIGTASKASTGSTGYSVSTGLTSYTQQASP